MIPYEFFFDPTSRQFGVGREDKNPFVPHDGFISISSRTARRIARKADIVAKMESFLNIGKIESLWTPGECELGKGCLCYKDGKSYAFYTEDENFIPMQISEPEFCDTCYLDKSQFKAMMLYLIFKQYFDIPLLSKQPEDYIEFSFYNDGTAIDGTGIRYIGEGLKPEAVCLVPEIPPDGCYVEMRYDELPPKNYKEYYEMRPKTYAEDEKISVSEFVKNAADRNASLRKKLKGSPPERDETQDMVEDGLIDIYGEPGGWQFNNED